MKRHILSILVVGLLLPSRALVSQVQAEEGDLSGWKWTGSQLKSAPAGTPQHNLWLLLCELFACMPPDLVTSAKVMKEDLTIVNPGSPTFPPGEEKKSVTKKGADGKVTIQFSFPQIANQNVYIAKAIVFEELWHATQKEVYKPPTTENGTPTDLQVELVMTNVGYDEVDARLHAAAFVSPMAGKAPPDKEAAYKAQFADENLDSVKRALKQMCTPYDKIANAACQGAEAEAKAIFKKCKAKGTAFTTPNAK